MSVQLSEGQTFGPRAINVTRTTLVRYAGASGDFNPIHYSDRAAREAGMDGVIAHGMWTMGAALGTGKIAPSRTPAWAIRSDRASASPG